MANAKRNASNEPNDPNWRTARSISGLIVHGRQCMGLEKGQPKVKL